MNTIVPRATLLAAWALMLAAPVHAQGEVIPLAIDSASPVIVKGFAQVHVATRYALHAKPGDVLDLSLQRGKQALNFSLFRQGSGSILVDGAAARHGARALFLVEQEGEFLIDVHAKDRSERKGLRSAYTLSVSRQSAPANTYFRKAFLYNGIGFIVNVTREGEASSVELVLSGLAIDNTPLQRSIAGTVTGAEVADLNADGSPEVYVYIRSPYGQGGVWGISANNQKSVSDVVMDQLENHPEASAGYRGQDEFAVAEGRLVRRFPVFKLAPGSETGSSGKMRQIQYRLVKGESSWQLVPDRIVEF